MLMNFRSFV